MADPVTCEDTGLARAAISCTRWSEPDWARRRPACLIRGSASRPAVLGGVPRRRPPGAAPPLPRALCTSGIGWLVAVVVAIAVTGLSYRNVVRGAAIPATVVDNTVLRWISDIDVPGINGVARVVSCASLQSGRTRGQNNARRIQRHGGTRGPNGAGQQRRADIAVRVVDHRGGRELAAVFTVEWSDDR